MDDHLPYWNRVADEKSFSHPLNAALFRFLVAPEHRVLDYGCGFGRIGADLLSLGYWNVVGVDPAPKMIARGRREYPALDLRVLEGPVLPFPEASFDAVLVFAVLTCIPDDDDQRAVLRDVYRVLRPGGIVYLSDMLLQDDPRNRRRYERFAPLFGTYGVFALPEGVVCRHHDPAWIATLTEGFDPLYQFEVDLVTMNGHPARAFQYLGRRSPADLPASTIPGPDAPL